MLRKFSLRSFYEYMKALCRSWTIRNATTGSDNNRMADVPGTTIPVNSPEGQRLNQLFELAKHIRGGFMDQSIWIDTILTDILATHFCPDPIKRGLLSSDVIAGPDSAFSSRIQLLRKILKTSYGSFTQEHPNFCDQLDKIRRFRNRLAHAHLDTSDAFLSKGYTDRIQLAFYEEGERKTQVITVAEIDDRFRECSAVILKLVALRALVQQDVEPQ